jgi:hypothetical protein
MSIASVDVSLSQKIKPVGTVHVERIVDIRAFANDDKSLKISALRKKESDVQQDRSIESWFFFNQQ